MEHAKRYAEMMQDRFEGLSEIRRVDIVGALDREIQINVDIYKAALAGVDDVEGLVEDPRQVVVAGAHERGVDACLRLGYTTVAITTLTFLGLGVDPSTGASWRDSSSRTTGILVTDVHNAISSRGWRPSAIRMLHSRRRRLTKWETTP